ncbi:MAG: tetratricopeptide repeat protein, partial [Kiloniellales bacterium]|nr:tetratricopeptide repeat protein [Kiloniellales bacterium]
ADIALDRNDLARAYETAERALRVNPQHLGACLVMGEVLCRQGDTEAALDHAVLALTQSPDHDGALELLALIRARRNPLFALWWRGEQAIKRLGPAFRVIAVLSIVMLYASLDWLFVGLGLLSWKYGLAAIFFPLGIYFAFGHMALSMMIDWEKRKIRLSSSF